MRLDAFHFFCLFLLAIAIAVNGKGFNDLTHIIRSSNCYGISTRRQVDRRIRIARCIIRPNEGVIHLRILHG